MQRRSALMAALLATLAASAWLALQPEDEVSATAHAVVRPAAGRSVAAASARAARPAAPPRQAAAWGTPTPGAIAAWAAPAPPPTAQTAASAPERTPPPRFPYTWIGQVDDGSSVQVLLNGPQRSFGARAGDVLDGRWRVERIAATRLQLTWLPTGEAVMVEAR